MEETEVVRKHPDAECEKCPLRTIGSFVPSVGTSDSKIAFIGEAPGKNEARKGIPFSGVSGKLLNSIMTHHGIKRSEVFLGNACSCRPPDNETPSTQAIMACRPRLLRELEATGVETVVALGNSAAQSLLGKTGVTKLRVGPGHESKHLPGVRVIATLHPAAALRQADLFPHIVTDIGKVVSPRAVWTEFTYDVVDDVDSAFRVISELESREGPLITDIEVDIEKDTGFGHPNQYGMLCVGVAYAHDRAVIFGENVMASEEVRLRLGELFRSKRLGGQNLKFDLEGLYPVLGPLRGWFDTMLASYCFDERPGIHGLEFQGIEYLGAPSWKHDIDKYGGNTQGYGVIPRPELYKYNASDCVGTYRLMDYYEEKFKEDEKIDYPRLPTVRHRSLRDLHDFLVDKGNELMYVELNGLAVNKPHLDVLTEDFMGKLEVLEAKMDDIIGYQLNPRSWQQIKKYLLTQHIDTESTDEEHLKFILAQVDPGTGRHPNEEVYRFVTELLKHRGVSKQFGTYVKGIRKRMYGGRVFPTFLLHGTTTGRLSCRNPNLQNIPRDSNIRHLFIPAKPERVFVQADYSQAELRVLSFLAGDTYFRDIFNAGDRDLFDELTPVLYPGAVPPSEHSTKEEFAAWKELRIRVKAFVYGLSYGRTEFSIAPEFGIPLSEAKMLKRNFFEVIPEIVQFQADVKKLVFGGNPLITPFGRRRRFPLITNENVREVENEALAHLPQSTSSDICLSAMAVVRRRLKGKGWIRNIVHDSILAECHEDDAEEVSSILNEEMLNAAYDVVGAYVKFATEVKVGKSWAEV